MGKATKDEVEKVLEDMRWALDNGKTSPIDRAKNINTLTQLGITWSVAKRTLYSLTSRDYISGPDVDRDYPDSDRFWKFRKKLSGEYIYIKFKVLYQVDGSLKIVSYHIDDYFGDA